MLRVLKIWDFNPYKYWKYQKFPPSCPLLSLNSNKRAHCSTFETRKAAWSWYFKGLLGRLWVCFIANLSLFFRFFFCFCFCFLVFVEDEWDKIHTGQDLVDKFNAAFSFTQRDELEQLAEIFRIIGKKKLQDGVNKFLGQSTYFYLILLEVHVSVFVKSMFFKRPAEKLKIYFNIHCIKKESFHCGFL